MRTVFLDLDGVVRLGDENGRNPAFCQVRLDRLREVCHLADAKIVVTSDHRHSGREWNAEALGEVLTNRFHDDWATPHLQWRWKEVRSWLADHPEITGYAILEDSRCHFEGCPPEMAERIVWCNNRFGFVETLRHHALEILNTPFQQTT